MMVIRVVGCAVVLIISLSGCSNNHSGPLKPPVEVNGVLRMTGGPAGVSQPGVQGRVSFIGPDGSGATTDIPTKKDGTFSLQLNPGSYKVTGHSPQYADGQGTCRTDSDVVVKSGVNDPVIVNCDRK